MGFSVCTVIICIVRTGVHLIRISSCSYIKVPKVIGLTYTHQHPVPVAKLSPCFFVIKVSCRRIPLYSDRRYQFTTRGYGRIGGDGGDGYS